MLIGEGIQTYEKTVLLAAFGLLRRAPQRAGAKAERFRIAARAG
jgi:hypothetical protein